MRLIADTYVVFALEAEAGRAFASVPNKIFTGLGKINAAAGLTSLLHKKRPSLIINFGSAGIKSRHLKVGSLVAPTVFIQRDMDCRVLNVPLFETPFDASPSHIRIAEHLLPHLDSLRLPAVTCGSGDSFDASAKKVPYDIVDMEGYALAKCCRRFNAAFLSVKYLTDKPGKKAAASWESQLKFSSEAFFSKYREIIKLLRG